MKKELKVFPLLLAFLACMMIALAFSLVYKFDNDRLKPIDVSKAQTAVDGYLYGIDPVQISEETVLITGWIAPANSDLTYVNRQVLLVDENKNYYEMNTISVDRGLTAYFDTGYNYDDGGMMAQCAISQLESEKKYKVAFINTELDGTQYLFTFDTEIIIDENGVIGQ